MKAFGFHTISDGPIYPDMALAPFLTYLYFEIFSAIPIPEADKKRVLEELAEPVAPSNL